MHFVTLDISNSLEELQELAWCPLSPSPRPKVLLAPISRLQCSLRRSDKVRAMWTLHWQMSLLALNKAHCEEIALYWRSKLFSCALIISCETQRSFIICEITITLTWLNSDASEAGDYRPVVLTSHTMKNFKRLIFYLLRPQVHHAQDPVQLAYQA